MRYTFKTGRSSATSWSLNTKTRKGDPLVATDITEDRKLVRALQCKECGNDEIFVEIMSHEAHLVDGALNYLHLLEAKVDRYLCRECGGIVELNTAQQPA
jgi:hypothetical protein